MRIFLIALLAAISYAQTACVCDESDTSRGSGYDGCTTSSHDKPWCYILEDADCAHKEESRSLSNWGVFWSETPCEDYVEPTAPPVCTDCNGCWITWKYQLPTCGGGGGDDFTVEECRERGYVYCDNGVATVAEEDPCEGKYDIDVNHEIDSNDEMGQCKPQGFMSSKFTCAGPDTLKLYSYSTSDTCSGTVNEINVYQNGVLYPSGAGCTRMNFDRNFCVTGGSSPDQTCPIADYQAIPAACNTFSLNENECSDISKLFNAGGCCADCSSCIKNEFMSQLGCKNDSGSLVSGFVLFTIWALALFQI